MINQPEPFLEDVFGDRRCTISALAIQLVALSVQLREIHFYLRGILNTLKISPLHNKHP